MASKIAIAKVLLDLLWILGKSPLVLGDCLAQGVANVDLPEIYPLPQLFTASEGVVVSRDFPNESPKLTICTFAIRGRPGTTITVTFEQFTIDVNNARLFFYLNDDVFDDKSMEILPAPEGGASPSTLTTPSNYLGIAFFSGNTPTGSFRLRYRINPAPVTSTVIMDSDDTTLILAILSVIATFVAIVVNTMFF